MATAQLGPILRYIRRLGGGPPGDDDDAALLQRFIRLGDAEAFSAIIRRHGPMVLGVCRRVLSDGNDVDDAFQAVFLLLVRKAGSLRHPERLGPWLHGVAHRVALKARSLGVRRRRREQPLTDLPTVPVDDLLWRDLRPVLDDAVRALPARYRGPVVLCYLQGMTHAEAARQLGCPPGTVATRLSRARHQLRARLVRRGVTLSAAALAAALTGRAEADVVPALLASTVHAAGSATVPSHITALTEGVCKAMLFEKLRYVVMALIAAAALGIIVLGYRSGAAEPTDPPIVMRPVPPAKAAETEGQPAIVQTTNFIVTAPTRGLAILFAEAAERHRKELATLWLGKELPTWVEPCPIQVTIKMNGTGGATTFEFGEAPAADRFFAGGISSNRSFAFQQSKVKRRNMHLEGSLERLLISALPHEITHTVFADYFGKPMVRWADEGAAVLSEDEDDQRRHDDLARQLVETSGRAIPLRRLLSRTDFPTEVMALYAEGYSLTRFLVSQKDRKTWLAFVNQGMDDGWDSAAKSHYGYRDVEAMEDAWLADVRRQRQTSKPLPAAPVRDGNELDLPASVPPVTGFAMLSKDGVYLRLREVGCVFAPTVPSSRDGSGAVVALVPVLQQVSRTLLAAETPVFGMDGKRIDAKKLPELLKKEKPVLVSQDGKMVDAFHLQLIKEGTLIIVPPPVPRIPQPVPPTVAR
jgi:RNA polymerase sigma factor (sigma-70 family)